MVCFWKSKSILNFSRTPFDYIPLFLPSTHCFSHIGHNLLKPIELCGWFLADCSGCTEPEDEISNTTLLRVLPRHWLPATFRRRMTARGNHLLGAFFCEALPKDFHIVSSFNYNLELFHGSFLKHIELVLVNCMGNPRVFLAIPTPVPVAGFTHEPAGFLVETSPRSSKTVKYWVSYEQNNQIDHKPLNIYPFWMIQGSFWSSWVQESIPVPVPGQKPAQNPWVYPYPCNTLTAMAYHRAGQSHFPDLRAIPTRTSSLCCCCRCWNQLIMPGIIVSWTSTLRDVGGLLS